MTTIKMLKQKYIRKFGLLRKEKEYLMENPDAWHFRYLEGEMSQIDCFIKDLKQLNENSDPKGNEP